VLQEVKYHPSSVDLELVKRLAAITTRPTLLQFLVKEFSCIPKGLAGAHLPCLTAALLMAQPHRQARFMWLCCCPHLSLPANMTSSSIQCVYFTKNAERLIEELRSGVTLATHPAELDTKQLTR
jgi:DNA topoisomerase VI subunit B